MSKELDPKLVEAFRQVLGEEVAAKLSPTATMNDIEQWDSLNFINLVFALEDIYGVAFSPEETAQLFSIENILNILAERNVLGA